MPPLPGEERTVTVFADVHYYFQSPSPRPLLHRFDKGSYFYIYHHLTRRTNRLEIANHPGTPDQDAFNGYLDSVRIVYSHKFPTLVTCIVDPSGSRSSASSPRSSSPGRDPDEWRLPSLDPRDEGKTRWRIHTLDCYFWMQEDAKLVIDTMRRLLHPSQLDIIDAPQTEARHEDSMSPVVQNLEHVAISDPAYANGQTRNSQNLPSQTAPPPDHGQQSQSPNPPSVASNARSFKSEGQSAGFAPMAYNPAAPPAPEPIAHREKTPPPVDAADGTGLAAAAVADHGPAYGVAQAQSYTGVQQPQSYTGVPGPAPSAYGHYGSTPPGGPPSYTSTAPPAQAVQGSPPGAQSSGHKPSFSSTTSSHAPRPTSASSPRTGHEVAAAVTAQSFAPPPKDPNAHLYGSGAAAPMQSPGAQIYGSGAYVQPHQPLQHIQPQYPDYLAVKVQPPPGGYSQYSYDQQPQRYEPGGQYDIHNQVYRPTELEVNKPNKKPSIKPYDGGYQTGKLEQKAEKVEKGVNSFLKRLEKKLG